MSIKPLSIPSLNKELFTGSTKVFNAKTDSALTSKKSTEKTADTVEVDLKNKPIEMNAGEYLLRQSLNEVSRKYGFNSSDVELEIVTRRQNKRPFSSDHDSYTNEKLAKDIKSGNTKIDFSINQSTIDKMKERKIVLQVVAEKEAYGGELTEQDYAQLEQFGYSRRDVFNLRNVKMMEYGGFQAKFKAENEEKFTQLNSELRQKMVKDELTKLQAKPDSDFYTEGNEKINPDFERRRVANEIVNRELNGETPFEYLRSKKDGDDFQKRLETKGFWDYLSNNGKNIVNKLVYQVGDIGKGIALYANAVRQYDDEGNKVNSDPSKALIYKAGDWLQKEAQFSTDKDLDQTFFGGTVPKTVGTVLPYVLGSWATATPKATTAILSGLSTGGAVYDEAIANKATEEQAQKTALLTGGFVGITSTVGFGKTLGVFGETIETLNRGKGSAVWKDIFAEAIKDGGRNAVVAGGQTIGENAIAKNIYDKDRGYLDNVRERMIAAGITGTALKGGLDIIIKIRAGKNPQTLAETQKTFSVKPQKVTNAKVEDLQIQGSDIKAKLNAKVETSSVKTTRLAKQEAVKTINQAKKNEPVITKDLQNMSKETGGELVGLDKRFKTEDSLSRKFVDRTQDKVNEAQRKGKNIDEVRNKALQKQVSKNNDALRYTYTFSPDKYAEGYNQTVKSLEKQGYKLESVPRNWWLDKGTKDDTGYRGINATFIAPNGQKFEVQFHTQESFNFKNGNHHLYEESRKLNISETRKQEIKKQNIKLAEPLEMPKDIDKIGRKGN
jgi:hypothetical protein